MSAADAVWNLGGKVARRLSALHKPFVRGLRRRARDEEQASILREAADLDERIAAIGRSGRTIIAGPWLAEVGYEVLYWIPFLRWFADAYGVTPDRLVILSRGGMETAYAGLAGSYADIFDFLTPEQLASRNAERQATQEGGGQKQSDLSPLDRELIERASSSLGLKNVAVLHPSMMFRLFRSAWHGNVPMDLFWRRTRYAQMRIDADTTALGLPEKYTAAKVYVGPALAPTSATRREVRELVARAAKERPVVLLATKLGIDEHYDFDLDDIPNVINLQSRMGARSNLGLQLAVIARAELFLGTCGGLAWLAPFLGVPTVALYDSDQLLAPHLLVERQAGKRTGAADFMAIDLRALRRLGSCESAVATLQ